MNNHFCRLRTKEPLTYPLRNLPISSKDDPMDSINPDGQNPFVLPMRSGDVRTAGMVIEETPEPYVLYINTLEN